MSLLDYVLHRDPAPSAAPTTHVRQSKPVSFVGKAGGGVKWESDDSMSAVVYRCVQAIASNAASLDLEVLRDSEVQEGHPVAHFFNVEPNPLMSARAFKEVLFARLEFKGQAFAYLDRGPNGEGDIQGVWPIYGTTSPVIDQNRSGADALLGFQVDVGNGKKVGLLPAEVLWVRYPDPDDAWGALAPWKAARFAAELDREIQSWQREELKNGGRAHSLVYLGDLTEDQHDAAVADFNASIVSGQKRHLLVSGPAPAGVSRLGATADELAYMETRRMNLEEACLAFGIPKDVLLGGATYENQRAAKTFLWSDTIVPKLETVASEVERQALDTGAGETGAFNVTEVEALQENADALATRTNTQLAHDLLTLDEGRARFGLEPLASGLGDYTLTAYRRAVFYADTPGAAPAERADFLDSSRRVTVVGARGLRFARRGPRPAPRERRADAERAPAPPAPLEAREAVLEVDEIVARYGWHEKAGERAMKRLAKRQEQATIKALNRVLSAERKRLRIRGTDAIDADQYRAFLEQRVHVDVIFDEAYWRDETRDALDPFLSAVWSDGATRTAKALGLSFSTVDPLVRTAMDARLDVLAGQVTATTKTILEERVLAPGVAAGASVDDLAADLKARFADLAGHRARTIARTETVGGFNGSSRTSALSSGVAAYRVWATASDSRVRDSHADMDGYRTTGTEDPYPNGCLYPGDPAGPSSETVNCRCVEMWETR